MNLRDAVQKRFRRSYLFWLGCFLGILVSARANEAADRADLQKTFDGILTGFTHGDVPAVLAYHHPDVVKALSPTKFLVGREAVAADIRGTFDSFSLEFVEHQLESLTFQGDVAVEITRFAVKGTPKKNGLQPFVFRGRAMVVYVRYAKSPSGWASLRELVQPAPMAE